MLGDSDARLTIADKAIKSEGYAIAFALLKLADAMDRMGMNRGADGMGGEAPGCLEKIAMEMADLVTNVGELANAVANAKEDEDEEIL